MTDHAHTVLLTATVPIAPAARPQFLAAARRLTGTAAGEQDVLGYTVAEDVTTPGTFVFVERYRDTAALRRHQSTPACQDYLADLPRWLAATATGHIHQAGTLDAIRIDPAPEGQATI